MMEFIDPAAPKTRESIHEARNQSRKERIAPYRPSIDRELAMLFEIAFQPEQGTSAPALVDWSFLDKDDGQSGEPADWVKKHMKRLEKWGDDDELHNEMLEELKQRHQWTRNIRPPSTPPRYDPNETPINPGDVLGDLDDDPDDVI